MAKRNKLFVKLVPIIILIIMIPLIIVGLISIIKSEKVLKENLNLTSMQLLEEVNKGFSKQIEINTQQINMVSKNNNLKDLSNTEKNHDIAVSSSQELFQNVKETLNGVVNVYYGGEYGEIIGCTKVKSINEFNYTEREWYQKAKKSSDQAIFTTPAEDAETGKKVMTIAQAVKDESGNFIGVLALDINIDALQEYVKSIKLLNEGYVLLVNNDGNIIVNNEKFSEKSLTQLSFWEKAKQEQSGIYEWNNNGDLIYVAQVSDKTTGWKLFGYVNKKEISNNINGIKLTMSIAVVICIIAGALIGIILALLVIKEINKINNSIQRIASGDLTERISVTRNDEFGELGKNFNMMVDTISQLINSIGKTSHDLFDAAVNISSMSEETTASVSEVSTAINQVATDATNQAKVSEDVNVKVEELANRMDEVYKNTDEINTLSNQTEKLSAKGLDILEELINKSIKTKENSNKSKDLVNEMVQSIRKINYMANTIADITEQTNLLSLNASIEAARAGEVGKGFSVVAEEIRKLAEQSKNSTDQIQGIITEINNKADSTYIAMQESTEILEEQDDAVEKTKDIFNNIAQSINPLTKTIKNIKRISGNMVQDKESVKQEVKSIALISEETASVSEEVTASVEEVNATMEDLTQYSNVLEGMANKLKDEINKFNIYGSDS